MATLYLVRHALTRQDPAKNMAEWELDPRGADDLARLAAQPVFAGLPRIVSSPEPKARLTAEAIRAAHGLPTVELHDGLREVYKTGWVGNHDEVMARVFAEPEQEALPGWERAADGLTRFSRCVEGLLDGRDLILVSHATVLSLWLAALQGQERVRFADWKAVRMPDLCVVDLAARRVVHPFGH